MNIQMRRYHPSQDKSVSSTPINNLPSEILAQLFTLISSPMHCLIEEESNLDPHDSYPLLPDALPHVCSRWRRITLGLHMLWAHIDITTSDSWCSKLLSRAELFAARLGPAQPHIHIITSGKNDLLQRYPAIQKRLEKISWFTAPVMQSFWVHNTSDIKRFTWIVRQFLPQVMPGMLTELALSDNSSVSQSSRPIEEKIFSTARTQLLNEILRPVRVLRLCNVWFSPTSHAYRELIDLRLHVDYGCNPFGPISSLIGVLSSCPGLRIFHCSIGFNIENAASPMYPVVLGELEVLNLQRMYPQYSNQLLAHIDPGTKPLILSLPVEGNSHRSPDRFLPVPVLDFFCRSQITQLFLDKFDYPSDRDNLIPYVLIALLISELPTSLRTLDLQRFHIYHEESPIPPSWPNNLDTLYMHSGNIDVASLQILTRLCPIRELMLRNSTIRWNTDDQGAIYEEIIKLAPLVSIVQSTPQDLKDG